MMGHANATMLWKHYHKAAKKAEADRYWKISPPSKRKIVEFSAAWRLRAHACQYDFLSFLLLKSAVKIRPKHSKTIAFWTILNQRVLIIAQ